MHSPTPASSLAESPPAASPQLGRWICCQQGLRSARILSLLPVLAAGAGAAGAGAAGAGAAGAGAAGAAASTTTALLAFSCLVTFRTGQRVRTSYMGSYTAMCRLCCCTLQCSKSVCPG